MGIWGYTVDCTPDAATDIIFSEYIEGDYDNKTLELYNGTGDAIDLTAGNYKVNMHFNGSTYPLVSIPLNGVVPNNDTFVLAEGEANATILAAANQVDYTHNEWFSGDDAIVLLHNGLIIDSMGQVGFDPGGQWGSGDTSTEKNTLRRRPCVRAGDTNSSDIFNPAETWMGYPLNSFEGLGAHETICNAPQTVTPVYSTTVITYDYDNLYRLTDASYTGDIEAQYQYAYDPVGNMKAYTETHSTDSGQAANTTRVTRYFDDANRLMTATDFALGSTSYTYDNNGNLALIVPPGEDDRQQHYAFNQRNLMISHALSTHGTNLQTQATFGYDGVGNRLQQVDYTGGSPATTTYANDIQGLTQVLLADNGTTQTANLFGFDLIYQQSNQQSDPLFLLTDGLGSVRQEVSTGAVAATTTYDPYGNVLSQSGESNTAYGYTGEQLDSATGLQYLRARYYNPAQRSFMGRDPWSGNRQNPQSMNGWAYVAGNPVNFTDRTGMTPESVFSGHVIPYHCKNVYNKVTYVRCVTQSLGVETEDTATLFSYFLFGGSLDKDFDDQMDEITGEPGCYWGPVPYRAPGYSEGIGLQSNPDLRDFSQIFFAGGSEIVYDFAKMKRASFSYEGSYISDSIFGLSISEYVSEIQGFRSWRSSIGKDYAGKALVAPTGIGWNGFFDSGISVGLAGFMSIPDTSIDGTSFYVGYFMPSFDAIPVLETGYSLIKYTQTAEESEESYDTAGNGIINVALLANHIMQGDSSPWQTKTVDIVTRWGSPFVATRDDAHYWAFKYAYVYETMYIAFKK